MMQVQQQPQFDWAGEAFTALHTNMNPQQDKWAALIGPASMPPQSFSIPPSLLTNAAIERYGQVTPPEELSPADPARDEREDSIPVEQLRNETTSWPRPETTHDTAPLDEPSPKRRRTGRQTVANQNQTSTLPSDLVPQQDNDANPQPPKRKRGRPKSQPQMVEAFTADGYPFQVSSARQTHLEKNRVAAHKCRQRKKEYINGLEDRAREFSAKNKMLKENVSLLREEVLGLKNEVLRHAGCGFWAVDEYLARCAGDLLGMKAPGQRNSTSSSSSRPNSIHQSPAMSTMSTARFTGQQARDTSIGSFSSVDDDGFGGLELLKDFDDEDMDDLEA